MRPGMLQRVALLATLAALCSCGDKSAKPSGAASASPSGANAGEGLCEHGVLEGACPKCNPALEAVYRAKGDWCGEHGFPESFCPICHPEAGGQPQPAKAKGPEGLKANVPLDGTKVHLKSKAIVDGMGLVTTKAVPSSGDARLTVPARLTYDATKTADINATSPGVVRKLLVDLGAAVKRGDPLAIIESAGVGADRARLGAAQKRVSGAEQRVARLTELEAAGAASRRERLDAERELADAHAEVGALSSQLSVLGAGAGGGASYSLTSPLDGVVAKRAASMGSLVDAEQVLFQIVDARTLWAQLDVAEADLAQIRAGDEVVLSFAALPGDGFATRIASIAPEVDPHTRTAVARASVDNANGRLRANMFGTAAVVGVTPTGAVTIPTASIQSAGSNSFVFVRTGDLDFSVRYVTIAERRAADATLGGGLKAGDEIVTTGAFLLKTETLKDSIGAGCCDGD